MDRRLPFYVLLGRLQTERRVVRSLFIITVNMTKKTAAKARRNAKNKVKKEVNNETKMDEEHDQHLQFLKNMSIATS